MTRRKSGWKRMPRRGPEPSSLRSSRPSCRKKNSSSTRARRCRATRSSRSSPPCRGRSGPPGTPRRADGTRDPGRRPAGIRSTTAGRRRLHRRPHDPPHGLAGARPPPRSTPGPRPRGPTLVVCRPRPRGPGGGSRAAPGSSAPCPSPPPGARGIGLLEPGEVAAEPLEGDARRAPSSIGGLEHLAAGVAAHAAGGDHAPEGAAWRPASGGRGAAAECGPRSAGGGRAGRRPGCGAPCGPAAPPPWAPPRARGEAASPGPRACGGTRPGRRPRHRRLRTSSPGGSPRPGARAAAGSASPSGCSGRSPPRCRRRPWSSSAAGRPRRGGARASAAGRQQPQGAGHVRDLARNSSPSRPAAPRPSFSSWSRPMVSQLPAGQPERPPHEQQADLVGVPPLRGARPRSSGARAAPGWGR